jgi:DNA gyrase/topoisomerase IV subunit B
MAETDMDIAWYKEFADSVALRPSMYLGRLNAKGFCDLLKGALYDLIRFYEKQDVFITLITDSPRSYRIRLETSGTANDIAGTVFKQQSFSFNILLLCVTSDKLCLDINNGENTEMWAFTNGRFSGKQIEIGTIEHILELNFILNETYYKTELCYHELNELCYELAILNKHSTILLQANYGIYPNQNFHHYSESLKNLLDRQCNEAHSSSHLLYIDEYFRGNNNRIGIAFQSKFYWDIGPISYAGYEQTIGGGSLLNGVIAGMMDVRTSYRKKHASAEDHHYSKYHFKGRLIIVCQIVTESNSYDYYGSLKEKLDMPEVHKDARRLIRERMRAVFENDPELELAVMQH